MSRKNVEDIYPLSPLQQGMLFHTLYAQESSEPGVYFVQRAWTMEGPLDVAALGRAFQEVTDRHPVLRTAFVWDRRDRPMQVVRERVKLPFEIVDLSALSQDEQSQRATAFLDADRARGFELSRAPLMRVTVLRLRADLHRVVWSSHHLLLDGWSTPLLVREIFSLYAAMARGEALRLPKPRPYGDYIGWIQKQDPARSEAFFRAELAGFRAPTPLGVDRPAREVSGEAFDDRRFSLTEAASEGISVFARRHQITVGTVLQGAWAILLSRYTGEEDVIFGATVSGRSAPLPGIEGMVGLFINTLPVRARASADQTVLAFLTDLHRRQSELRDHEHVSLIDIQGWSEVPRGTPLFESILVFENFPFDDSQRARIEGVAITPERTFDRASSPLTVVGSLRKDLSLRVTYDRRRFDDGAVDRMLGHLATLIEGIVADADRPLWALPILPAEERARVLAGWNDTAFRHSEDALIHEVFAAQVARTPDAPALAFEGTALRYRDLDARANQLAHALRKRGVGPEVLVGVCMERSIEMVVALYGVLKAGGAYVPLDPEYPKDRLAFMLEDARPRVILTQSHLAGVLPEHGAEVIALDTAGSLLEQEPATALERADLSLSSLAYVIYTSGSTGRPKGAMNEHRGILNRLSWMQHAYGLGADDRVLQKTPFSFDVSVWEFFWPLMFGAQLVVARPGGHREPGYLADLIEGQGITTLHFVPSMLKVFLDELEQRPDRRCRSLRRVMCSGEALPSALAARFFALLPGVELHNLYGPTEAAVDVTALAVQPDAPVTIGRPIHNTRIYLLDAHHEPVPIGVRGELYIGGVQVGRGYLNRAELTAERFVKDPFAGDERARMYRTGDVARWLPDGQVEYLGRADFQVKLRGFRIELGEIESTLLGAPAVRDAVVVAREERLVAYLVCAEGAAPPATGELRAFLGERLPEYMIPSAFVVMPALPLTASGKVDRRALPAPDAGVVASRAIVPPRGPVEEALAGIFADILKLDPARVGAHDGFFELGGHSLLAAAAIGRIRAALGVEIPLRALFDAGTPAALAHTIQQLAGASLAPPMERAAQPVLSFAQERLWFLAQLAPDDPSYHIPLSLRLEGPLDVAALDRALRTVVSRHEVLRTHIVAEEGKPVPVIGDGAGFTLEITRVDGEEAARREAAAEARRPFELATGLPLRARLLVIGDHDHQLLLTMHHIVSDGWSLGVLYREISALYAGEALAPLPVQYADYASWQRRFLSGDVYDRQLAFWKQALAGAPRAVDLPADRPRPPMPSHRGSRHVFTVPVETVKALKELSRREGATLFMTALAVFYTLLYRYTGQTDLLVGAPIAGRSRAESEGLIGFFVNTLVLRAELAGDLPFRDLLERVKRASLAAYAHQDMPFEQLVREIEPTRDPSRSPIFQVSFTLQAEPTALPDLASVRVRRAAAENTTAKFDLFLSLTENASGLAGMIEYATDLFDPPTIERMAGHYAALLDGIGAAPTGAIGELPLLSQDERRRVVEGWNATATDYPRDATIDAIFDEQAARSPEAIAVAFGGERLTYRALQERANRLAQHLVRKGVSPGHPVGLYARRSIEMVVATLAILKAGGVYVPLDPEVPDARLVWLVADAGARMVIAAGTSAAERSLGEATVVDLATDAAEIAEAPDRAPDHDNDGGSLAYIMYTSGSTGQPKGVCVVHRGVVRLVKSTSYARFGEDEVFLQLAPIAFDAATLEIWGALLNGGKLAVFPPDLPTPERLGEVIRDHGVTALWLTAGLFNAIIEAHPAALRPLRQLLTGGEALSVPHVQKALRELPGVQIINGYGPTEGTTFTCCHPIASADGVTSIPIGRPIANTVVYVLDERFSPAPIGVAGELYIGGDGLARGYLNRPELDAERFVRDPFRSDPSARLYKTGDRVRWLPDGTVAFLGRLDLQVKLRGFRIELGEIEAVLGAHPGVAECVVIVREDAPGDRRLVAYVVAGEKKASAADLRAHLKERLPDYMIPAAFVTLEALPLTVNGKVDRRALPAPEMEVRGFTAPRGPVEEAIAAVFAEVLRVPEVGAHDGFFELGGHSLLATQAIARLRSAFGVDLPLRALFESPSPADLAKVVELLLGGEREASLPIERVPEGGDLQPSFAQERLWFMAQLDPDDPSYVIPTVARLSGALDADALRRALSELVRRHAVLRTTFASRGGAPVQVIQAPHEIALPISDVAGEEAALREVAEELRRPFDLERGPILRARLLRLGDDDHLLVIAVHHIASDGWSQAILHRELGALYEAFAGGRPSPLPDLAVDYAGYAAWQRRRLSGDVLARQLAYWKGRLGEAPRALDLPADRPRPPVPSHRGEKKRFTLPVEIGSALAAIGRKEGATLFMTLLAAFEVLLLRTTGQTDLVVGTPIAGRARAELEPLVGFFVNNLVLRVEASPDLDFRALLGRVREACLGAYAHQDMPFERLVSELSPERDLSRAPLFQVMFTVESSEPRDALSLSGLELRRIGAAGSTAKLDLSVSMTLGARGFGGVIEYATDLFDAASIDRLVTHLGVLLEGIVAHPDRPIHELPVLAEEERRLLTVTWNESAAEYPRGATIHGLFEAHASRDPHAAALLFEGRATSYGELDARANQLARYLQKLGVGPESRVGISLRRSPRMIEAILGTLKAGGAWVPLDPTYPKDRLAFMIEDSQIGVLLDEERLDADAAAIAAESPERPASPVTGAGAAYVIYTSGSTGRPKGVVVLHEGLGNVAAVHAARFGVGPGSRVLQFSSMNFDASVWETVMALLNGATLVLAPQDDLLPGRDLLRTLGDNAVTIMTVPPSVLAALPHTDLPALDTIVVAGEACSEDLVSRWAPGRHFWNAYGPTETTICATMGECFAGAGKPSIGKPIANMRVYVLDAQGEIAAIGVPGELCIGGVGLARGYLNRAHLTAERFIESAFGRLYRTGDLARWLADGTLDFLGRIDHQVKLRGFRIELGEIDAVLKQHPGVVDAITIVRDDRLVAYVVPGDPAPSAADLRAYLKGKLPDHMVPAAIVALDSMPLTPNGKIDRRALPAPDLAAPEHEYVAPRGPVEETIASIFAAVLRVDRVSARDGFFDLGGHSLLAAQAVARVRDAFGIDLPLRALFEAPSPADLAAVVEAARARGGAVAAPISRVPRDGEMPLSFAQERLWFLDQLEPGDASYVVPLALRLSGSLDVAALARALSELTARHEVLRTTFSAKGGRPTPVIHASVPLDLPVRDLSAEPDSEAEARREAAREAAQPFDLAKGPVIRARLLRLGERDHVLLLSMHHIVADGWTIGVIVREVSALYTAFLEGRPSPLPDLPVQYADYAAWQRGVLAGEALDRQLDFWKQALAGSPRALELPTDRPRPPVPSHRGGSVPVSISAATAEALDALGRREGATLFMTLLAAFDVLLARTSGQRDLVVGSPIAGRNRPEIESLAGFFSNTLVLRAQMDDEMTFVDHLRRVRETCLSAYAHEDLPFERLVQEIEPERDTSRTPLFQVTFTLQNEGGARLTLPGLTVRGLGGESATAKFDLSLALAERAGALSGAIEFAADLFDAATIDRLATRLRVLLDGIARDPSQKLWQLPLLDDRERARLLAGGLDAPAEYPPHVCLHELFEAQVDRRPDAVAVTCEGRSLTYRELDTRANQVAHALRKRGVVAETLVGLRTPRSLEMIIGLVGILKAGGAYLPLDPEYPQDRLAFMIEDSRVPVVLTPESVADALAHEPSTRIAGATSPSGLAYVIYTSGSTGKPKGALVTHHNVVRLFEGTQHWYGFDAGDVWTMFHSYAFDFSVWEIWGALLYGGRLVVVPYWISRSPEAFLDLLTAERVTVLNQTPSAFRQLVRAEESAGATRDLALRYVIFGGEALDVGDLAPFWDRHGDVKPQLVNMYGITETTVHVTYRPVSRADLAKPWSSVIGVPIPDLRVYVLDAHRQPAPIGVVGEMFVGGAGVARGYLARPELTAERFIDDPHHPGQRLYKTGDLARWLASGDLEYLGRIDHQVKIRGFRIELGEIESALDQHPSVREAVVIAREDEPGDKRLVAYLVSADSRAAIAELRAFLKQRLPDYMVPAAFVFLDAMPLGPTGKTDRKALPAPEASAPADRLHVPPRGPVEEALAGIYASVLKVAEVSADDGFFDLGGHSLLATQAIARIRDAFGVELPLRALFEAPTVAELARAVDAALREGHGVAAPPITRAPRDAGVALSFAQERLWFLDQLEPGDPSYIVPMALRLTGALDASALSAALTEIVRRHEVLRTAFTLEKGKPAAVIAGPMPVELPLTRWPALSPAEREEAARREIAAESRRPFDLRVAPFVRARLFELAESDHVLSLTVHHIVSDAWTQGVLNHELCALYGAFARREPSPLPELAVQYADFAAWQRSFLSGEVMNRQLTYWKAQLVGAPTAMELPADYPRPPVMSHAGGRRSATFPADLLASLQEIARGEGATLFMVLLAALDVLLHRYTGQTDIVVGSPIAGRTRAETEPLIGFFVNTLVLRTKLADDLTFRDLLHRVRESCLGAYAHQDMPFERLVNELSPDRDLSRTPLFQVLFALQNAGGGGLSLPGLGVRGFGAENETSKFDLTLVMGESPAGLAASFEYATDLFEASTIERMLAHLQTLLAGIAARPDARIFELPVMPEGERKRLVVEWNDTGVSFAPGAAIHEMFEAQVDRTPDAPAVTFEGTTLTYRQLDGRANQVAHALVARGVGPEVLVGLCVQRSLEMIIGLVGILKAGGAYLPLDPEYPKDRLAFMVEDSRVPVIITQESVSSVLPVHSAALIRLDADADVLAKEPTYRLGRSPGSSGLAYVIYTSGSTGKPKGALVTHHNVVRLFQATEHWYHFDAGDVWTMFHSYAFDFSVWEIWGALLYGGRLVVVPYWVSRAPDTFYQLLVSEGVTVLNQTPSAFRQLVHAEESVSVDVAKSLRLRYVIFGGEALDLGDLRPWWERHGDTRPQLVNMYGITETTVHVTYRPVGMADLDKPWSSVIGVPIPDLQVYILDMHRQPVPTGITGEMYVGGAGVSRGYLSRPELTAERFIDDPFRLGNKLYKTGDLARHLASGDVEYLGRIDHQVKIRGFRIELGEIEAVLDQHPAVRESVVLARADGPGEKRLVAYLVSYDGPRPTVGELRGFVKQKLPDMMVPAAFVLLDALPLTENGKIDRKALPAPEEAERPDLGETFVAPTGVIEGQLAEIWASVLRLDKVGVHDNFFEVGGDSILSIQIVARAQAAGLRVTPRQIFQHPTIAELASVAGTAIVVKAEQGAVTGPVSITPIQRWWLEQRVADPSHWNQAFFLEVRDRMDPAVLGEVVARLVEHHDVLRLRVTLREGGDRQTIAAPGGAPPFQHVDLSAVPEAERRARIEQVARDTQRGLDLESGPVARFVLIDLGPGEPCRLLAVIHHMAVDGVSWRVLLDDLWTAYEQRLRGEPMKLPEKTSSFKQWGEKLAEYARSPALDDERIYWLSEVRGRAARLPVDHHDGENTEESTRTVSVSLAPEETEDLLRKVPEAYQTQINDILLTALAQAFEGWTGSSVSVVDMEGHGREEIFDDIDLTRTVGWFTSIYPLVLELPDQRGVGAAIKSVKEQIRAVPGRGLGYGLLRYLCPGQPIEADLAALPASEVSFNYLGQLDQAIPESSPFRFARESSGLAHSPRAARRYLIDVTANVRSGRLGVHWTYSEARHDRATIERLAEAFLSSLRALVEHCLSPEAGGYTPSDFQEQVSQNVIDMLAALDDDESA